MFPRLLNPRVHIEMPTHQSFRLAVGTGWATHASAGAWGWHWNPSHLVADWAVTLHGSVTYVTLPRTDERWWT